MDEFAQTGREPEGEGQIAALTARVAELERVVAALQSQPARGAEAVARKPLIRDVLVRREQPPSPPVLAETADSLKEPAPAKSLEDRLGSQVFNMVGIVALIVGSAWALKLAIEHGYLGPVARVLVGIAAGVGLVLWSESFRRKGLKAFSYSLKAVGSGVLYLTLWAGFQIYHLALLSAPAALGLMILVTAWNAFMAWSQDSELLAGYALFGGFATPLLLSTGGNHETFLFIYIGAIDLATVVLLRTRPWRRLLPPAFLATVAFFIGWYAEWFHRQTFPVGAEPAWNGESTETVVFIALLFTIFALVSLKGWMRDEVVEEPKNRAGNAIVPVLLPLGNAAFLSLALYSVLEDSGLHILLAWLMVALAALYLGLVRVQRTAVSRAMYLALAIVFLTVAIPLKASGHALTTAWLVEGLLLFWVSTRFALEERAAIRMLGWLSAGGYALGLGSLLVHWMFATAFDEPGFFTADLGSALVAICALGGAVWIAVRDRNPERGTERMALAALVSIDLVATLLTFRDIGSYAGDSRHAAFANAPFATALVGLAALAGAAWVAWRLARAHVERFGWGRKIAAGTVIAFNLLAILCVEREIGALWHRTDANLQRSLAISGFLMLYGAALLAIGFWRRTAFVRWQALVLLLFTICKVFLYDTGSLSAGYRVASFMGLGAVLMGVSLAYQKDWLGLKEPVVEPVEREA